MPCGETFLDMLRNMGSNILTIKLYSEKCVCVMQPVLIVVCKKSKQATLKNLLCL